MRSKRDFLRRNRIRTSECRYCAETIKAKALLCHNCGKRQDWKRFLSYGNSTLALFVALLSVASLGIPLIVNALKPDNSVVTVALVNRTDVMVPIIASNKGSRLAVIGATAALDIKFIEKHNSSNRLFLFMNQIHDANNIIAARDSLAIPEGTSKLFYYQVLDTQINREQLSKFSKSGERSILEIESCTFNVSYINFNGEESSTSKLIYKRNSIIPDELLTSMDLTAALDCLIKIPEPLLDEYKIFQKG